jgi:hypothetical protein
MCGILEENCLANWRFELARACDIVLTPEATQRLIENWREKRNLMEARRAPEFQLQECRRRWEKKQRDKQDTRGQNDYRSFVYPDRADDDDDSDDDDDDDRPLPPVPNDDQWGDEMIPYARAVAFDPFIEVPLHFIDRDLEMVRNELRFAHGQENAPGYVATNGPRPFREMLSDRLRESDLAIDEYADREIITEVEAELDQEDEEVRDDDEHEQVMFALPRNLELSDRHFQSEGVEGNTFVIRCLDPSV